jgi:hypothetical protein
MVVESRRENYSVSDYMNTGRRWYAATNVFNQTTGTNNSATTNNNSTGTSNNLPTATNNNLTTTATNNPPIVSLFQVEEESDGGNILFETDLASRIAIRVAHMNERMKCQAEHFSLKSDLMNHLWQLRLKRRRDNNINNEEEE